MSNIQEKAEYCLSCKKPRCQSGCPVGNDIRDFIKELKNGDVQLAADVLYNINPFPELTSRLCDCDRQCQGHCVRGIKGEPVEIQLIERYISNSTVRHDIAGEPNGRKVAIIGAGVSGVAAARDLRLNGFDVTIFEKDDASGGAAYTGIPSYRFNKKHIVAIEEEMKQLGVEFRFNTVIDNDNFSKLLEGYDRVLVANGAQKDNLFGMSAEKGYISGLKLLRDLNVNGEHNKYRKNYKKAVVWGGGNVAMDCARSLVRILDEVHVVYRRSQTEMPANRTEIADAEREGVIFDFLTNIKDLKKDKNNNVYGIDVAKMQLGEADSSGRASCSEIPGSIQVMECDLVVAAIGQKVEFDSICSGLEKTDTHLSSVEGVYISGDAYTGPKTIASSIKDGRDAAKEIMESF